MELMVTTMIVGVLAMVVVPGMGEFLKNERLTTQINSLLSHLQYARSEALLRHKQVVVCASSNGATCAGSDWKLGWIVFFDEDADGAVSGSDVVLKVRDKLDGNNSLGSSMGASVVYDYRGFAPNSSGTFSLCDSRGAELGKSLAISLTGRARVSRGATTCP